MRNLFLSALMVLFCAGCASTATNGDWFEAEQARQARLSAMAERCVSDLCVVMIAQEQGRSAIRPPQQQHHPAWGILDRALAIGVPAYFGSRQIRDLAGLTSDVAGVIAGMDRADNSVTIGGDSIGRDRIDDRSVDVGGDSIGRDRIDDRSVGRDRVGGDWRQGDNIRDSCVGPDCRSNSPGPIDNSDNSTGQPDEGGDP